MKVMCTSISLSYTYDPYWTGSKSSARVCLVHIKMSERFPIEVSIMRFRVILIKYNSHGFKSPSFYTDCLSVSIRNGPHYGRKKQKPNKPALSFAFSKHGLNMNQLTSKFSPDAVTNHDDKHASACYETH